MYYYGSNQLLKQINLIQILGMSFILIHTKSVKMDVFSICGSFRHSSGSLKVEPKRGSLLL